MSARIAARGPEDDYDVVSAVLRKAGYPEATDPAADVASVLGKAAADALRDANRGSAGAAYLLGSVAAGLVAAAAGLTVAQGLWAGRRGTGTAR